MAKQDDFDIGYIAKHELELNEISSIKKLKLDGTKQDNDATHIALQTALPRSISQRQQVMVKLYGTLKSKLFFTLFKCWLILFS